MIDRIVSTVHGAEPSLRHEGSGFRLDRKTPYLRLYFLSVYVHDQERSLLRCDGGLEPLDATCTVVGLFDEWQCSMAESRLNAGDTLLLYTERVPESFNSQEEDFGDQRLIDALRRHSNLPAIQLSGALVEEVLRFSGREQYDDITLIVAKRVDIPEREPC